MSAPAPGVESDLGDSAPESPSEPASSSPALGSPTPSPEEQYPTSLASQQLPLPNSTPGMTASSAPLGNLNAARRPGPLQPTLSGRGGSLPPEMEARMKAFHLGRQGTPPVASIRSGSSESPNPVGTVVPPSSPKLGPGGVPSNFRVPPGVNRARPPQVNPASLNQPSATSLAQKRGMALPGGLPSAPGSPGPQKTKKKPGLTLSQINGGTLEGQEGGQNSKTQNDGGGSLLDKYADFIDAKSGSLRFKGKATLTSQGVEFSSGNTFSISLDEVDTLDELGKGNYGTVYKVRHSRPRMRRPGQGLAGNKSYGPQTIPVASTAFNKEDVTGAAREDGAPLAVPAGGTSGVVMAMKEIRLELEDAKFAAIIMELDILHRCASPHIVDFYGAFFQEGAVYICMEFMDGGSIDKLYGGGIPESVLRKITWATTTGLKSLKDDHNIIHRDVKPTNILVNTRGQVKICDFGVSGNLVASIAKTNIGCQSYMAPERISSGGVAQAGANPGGGTYSVQSDIWSLGLTIIECALGQYPYPPETYDNIFSQLSAIVDGEPPDLPADRFSAAAREFVRGCLMKIPKLRPTYSMLLQHPWLAPLAKPATIAEEDEEDVADAEGNNASQPVFAASSPMGSATEDVEVAQWVISAIEKRRNGTTGKQAKPALHAAPLDAVVSPTAPI